MCLHKIVRSFLLNYVNLLGPILFRFSFFALNLYFAVQITSTSGWNFFSIILALFATREFVGTIQMGQVLIHLKKVNDKKQNKNNNSNK